MAELVRSVQLTTWNGPTVRQGVAALIATRSLDIVTTVFGLALVPQLEEANPVARVVFEELGVLGGSLFLSLAALVFVTLATELGVRSVERSGGPGNARILRYVGYGVPSAVSLAAALHNVRLIAATGAIL
jgi:hypothetical protein